MSSGKRRIFDDDLDAAWDTEDESVDDSFSNGSLFVTSYVAFLVQVAW